MQHDAWVQVSREPGQWAGTLAAAGLPNTKAHNVVNVRSSSSNIKHHGEVPEREDSPWSPACTHMSQSENETQFQSPPGGGGGGTWRTGVRGTQTTQLKDRGH